MDEAPVVANERRDTLAFKIGALIKYVNRRQGFELDKNTTDGLYSDLQDFASETHCWVVEAMLAEGVQEPHLRSWPRTPVKYKTSAYPVMEAKSLVKRCGLELCENHWAAELLLNATTHSKVNHLKSKKRKADGAVVRSLYIYIYPTSRTNAFNIIIECVCQ